MNNLITVLTTIDPTEVEGLLARFGLHPTVLAVVLYAIAVINFLIPVLGPFIYRLFGNKIQELKTQIGAFKSEFLLKIDSLEGTQSKLELSVSKIAESADLTLALGTKVDIMTDLLFVVLENSRLPEETKEKVKEAKATREVTEKEYKRLSTDQSQAITALQKQIAEIKATHAKALEQLSKNKKKR